jgi:phage terminase large subunit-like protein
MQARYGGLAAALADALESDYRSRARPEQLPPLGDWSIWLALSGRGFGKTWMGSSWINECALSSVGRIALIGPTASDVRDTMIEGDSGVMRTAPSWARPIYEPSRRRIEWPNGSIATTFSAEEPDRLRGPQHHIAWFDELAAYPNEREVWDMCQFGLRLGRHPRCLVTTTPRPKPLIRELLTRDGRDVVVVRGRTFDNAANLAPGFLDAVRKRYAGTRLGRQELDGEVLLDVPGALWEHAWIEANRVTRAPLDLTRIVVAIDPAVSTTENSDETGIIVAGIAGDHVYVLADASGRMQPHEWARRALALYAQYNADQIVCEGNQGGDLVTSTVRTQDRFANLRKVHASRGKVTRAEPVSALYQQGRVHHVGQFRELEDQLVQFTSDFDRARAGYSPDRLDALVWAITELSVKPQARLIFG